MSGEFAAAVLVVAIEPAGFWRWRHGALPCTRATSSYWFGSIPGTRILSTGLTTLARCFALTWR